MVCLVEGPPVPTCPKCLPFPPQQCDVTRSACSADGQSCFLRADFPNAAWFRSLPSQSPPEKEVTLQLFDRKSLLHAHSCGLLVTLHFKFLY